MVLSSIKREQALRICTLLNGEARRLLEVSGDNSESFRVRKIAIKESERLALRCFRIANQFKLPFGGEFVTQKIVFRQEYEKELYVFVTLENLHLNPFEQQSL